MWGWSTACPIVTATQRSPGLASTPRACSIDMGHARPSARNLSGGAFKSARSGGRALMLRGGGACQVIYHMFNRGTNHNVKRKPEAHTSRPSYPPVTQPTANSRVTTASRQPVDPRPRKANVQTDRDVCDEPDRRTYTPMQSSEFRVCSSQITANQPRQPSRSRSWRATCTPLHASP